MPCSKGQIVRKSYIRKSSKTKSKSKVKAKCIKDIGKKGHSKQVLPPFSKKLSLRGYGYNLSSTAPKRHQSLEKATEKIGTLPVLRHLNLVRNYTSNDFMKNKQKLSQDVKYLQKLHKLKK